MEAVPARSPGSASSDRPTGLPPGLLKDAATRLGWLALVTAIIIPIIQVAQSAAQPDLARALDNPINRLVSLAAVLLAFGVYALQRYRVVSSSTLLGIGLVFESAVALCVSLIETTIPVSAGVPVLGISSLGPWIVAFGVFIPNRPVVTLLSSLAAATTWPVAYAFNAYRFEFPAVPVGKLLVWPVFNYLVAVLAYLIGRRMYGMTIAANTAVELGSYRLVAPIGEGGMGEVWKASHQMLARSAAIKLVRPQLASGRDGDTAARRFQREANIIASLQSPHTVYLYDFGSAEDGRFYYVMELLDGVSLQALVTTFGPQPAARVRPILEQICLSLAEAHEMGLVHRDLKPSNVMLCKVGVTYDFVKVLDFGLAKCFSGQEVSQLTMEGATTGTPGYMAPEVAMGENNVDGRADIYALGCVAYFLLTGTLVFNDPNPMSLALKHVQTPPEPPSARTELEIPDDLERVVMRCLAKNPMDRPASASELAGLIMQCRISVWTPAMASAWWHANLPATSSLRSFAQTAVNTPPRVRKA